MDTYTFLRELADSWVLLAMFGFFASVGVWACLPSQTAAREAASLIPFRVEPEDGPCGADCATCACKTLGTGFDPAQRMPEVRHD
ncbi:cytochrome c oxidase cbb3-type subunit 4 [Loktanella fryxellensis]|uniref:Cytochrome c oxidase cbb3-type subunit 4 n=1 Tax=Loktanella fryxellensis TaxID=245187 RepID=A0A1H8HAF6_9RHOB|nr:cbb3-type cytochrome c oxidase subunit 3 [Loktanella fryxellensis]SEN53233.1 cytochrome c oxidase cbb3-type subunit 4 [Loktanella fryxellensis]